MLRVVLILLLIPLIGFSQSSRSSVSGVVKSESGEKLIGAVVILKNIQKGIATDTGGAFTISNVPAGNYDLEVRFVGYQVHVEQIQLNANQQLKLKIQLKEDTQMLSGVEVEGKSISTEINEQAYAVTALEAKDFNNSTSDVKEILNKVTGVRVLEEGGLGSDLSFSLNGFSGDQVKFFLDGIPMDNFGSSLSLSSIPVNTIQRIEVYRGVVPVWLGTDALGGAVNIITNQNSDFLDASYSFGSFNTHRSSVNGASTNKENGFTIRGSLAYNYSDNNYKVLVPIVENNNVEYRTEVERFHDRYKSATARIETGVVNRTYADQLLIGAIVSADDKQVQHGTTMAQPYGGIIRDSKSFIPTLKYKKEDLFIDGLDVSFNSSFNISQTRNIDTLRGVSFNWLGVPEPTQDNLGESGDTNNAKMEDKEFTSQLNIGYQIHPKHSLAFNYAFQYFNRETFDSEHPENIANQFPNTLNKIVLGLAYKFDHNEKWSTTAFGKAYILNVATTKEFDFGEETRRTDVFEATKQSFGYGLATSYYLLPQLQIKASYEHSYRMPWANEIFGNGMFVQPNADLDPEKSDNLNVGAAWSFKVADDHRFNLESSFIYRESKDLIYQIVTVSNPETSFGNLAEIGTLGVEGVVNYQWKKFLNLGVGITYQNITDQADLIYNDYSGYQTNFNKGYRLPNKPYLFGNGSASMLFDDIFTKGAALSVNYFYNFNKEYFLSWAKYGSKDDKKVIPGQSSHNLELSYSLAESKYNVAIECRNLTDERLYDKYYLQKPGRAFYLKVRYAIGK